MIVALHAPDGFLEAPVALATAILSILVLAVAMRSSDDVADRQIPLAGVAAAFIFAAQMFNFPVASGTTGHLLGAALAAVLLGPRLGVVVVSVVVVVQALLFADGGLTALGVNTLNMAIVPTFGGWAAFRMFRKVLPNTHGGVIGATGLAAGVSVVMSSMAFSLEWLFGASAPVPFDTVFGAMVGVHMLIGIGEGVISGLVIAAVLASRSDLVVGAADLAAQSSATETRIAIRTFLFAGLLTAIMLAAVVSQFAADSPDGLERVAADTGFSESAAENSIAGSLFADYATSGIDNEQLSLAVAGIAGVALTLAVGYGMAATTRKTRPTG